MIHPDEGKKKRPPTALQVAHWITFKEEQRLEWQKAYLARLCQADQEIAHTYELIQGFTTMLRERQGDQLDSWLKVVKEQGVAELQCFAQGLERDYDAVKAGLTLEWSQGPVEGHVHRLKLIKRQAYGRASFQTLRSEFSNMPSRTPSRGTCSRIIESAGDPVSVARFRIKAKNVSIHMKKHTIFSRKI